MSKDIGPTHTSNSNDQRKQVRKAERDPWNRILSVLQDAEWVMNFCHRTLPNVPIVPNLRCGAWYVPPSSKDGSSGTSSSASLTTLKGCYFKSTDGHINQWGFSLKRYNPAILTLVQEQGACVIIDSTRRGKSMPDALSKTIPIWCAVINEASRHKYGLSARFKNTFRVAEHVISPSEHSQIVSRMEDWVDDLLDSDLEIPHLQKALKPIFVSRSYVDPEINEIQINQQDYYPIILVSASPMVSTPMPIPQRHDNEQVETALDLPTDVQKMRRDAEFVYVQGSGDDEEMWSSKLTPRLLWQPENIRQILATKGDEEALRKCLEMIVIQDRLEHVSINGSDSIANDVQIGNLGIWFGSRSQQHTFTKDEREKYSLIVQADGRNDEESCDDEEKYKILKLDLEMGKRGLNAFRQCVPQVILAAQKVCPGNILLCSSEQDGIGHDLNGALAVCILATCFDEDKSSLKFDNDLAKPFISQSLIKDDVQKRLQWISTLIPHAKPPSRKYMLRINEVLLSQEIKAHAEERNQRGWF